METEAKFSVPSIKVFDRLQAADRLADYALSPGEVKRVHDVYLDTPDRALMAAGYVCRRREQDAEVLITLKQLKTAEGAIHRREELEIALPDDLPPAQWPAGPTRERVIELIGESGLVPLCDLDQVRIVRRVMEGERPVAELSLDGVHVAADEREVAYFEVEAELTGQGTEEDLAAIAAVLQDEWRLNPEPRSKFERALAFVEAVSVDSPVREQASLEERVAARPATEVENAAPEQETASERASSAAGRPAAPRKPPKEAGLRAEDTMAEAARKTFNLHFQRMLYHEPGTRLGEDIEELHDMRVATRRMRAAFDVFGEYLDRKALKRILKGLRRTGRTLGAVRDLDVFWEKSQHYLDSLPPNQQVDLEPLRQAWQAERQAARERMAAYLDGERYARFKEEFQAYLQTPDAGALPAFSRQGEPLPRRLRHVAPMVIYQRLAAVWAYGDWVSGPDVPLERLHQLRIAAKGLRYTLEFFQEVLGPEAKTVIDEVKGLQDHLGNLQDAVVASGLLRDFLIWGTWGHTAGKGKKSPPPAGNVIAPGVATYLAARQTELRSLLDGFPPVWARLYNPETGRLVAASLSPLYTRQPSGTSTKSHRGDKMTVSDQQSASSNQSSTAEPGPKYIILLGAPASGKGTQAAQLREALNLPHIASGDLFRENLRRETELGKKAKAYMDRGELVPDDVTNAMVMDRLGRPDAANGAILDGFPRTIAQAEALDRALAARGHKVNLVLNIEVPEDVLVERVSGRRLCRVCGESYHVRFNPPKQPGVCDQDGGELYQREDDKPETVRKRLQVYCEQTCPVIDYYRQQGVLVEIDGDQAIEAVQADLRQAVAAL